MADIIRFLAKLNAIVIIELMFCEFVFLRHYFQSDCQSASDDALESLKVLFVSAVSSFLPVCGF